MKKIFLCLSVVFVLSACVTEPEKYVLNENTFCSDGFCVDKRSKSITGFIYYSENGVDGFRALNGKLDFIEQEYYENGKLESKYKNGKLDGVQKYYYASGKLCFENNYKNGKRDGVQKSYYENGKLESETTYKEGIVIEEHYY